MVSTFLRLAPAAVALLLVAANAAPAQQTAAAAVGADLSGTSCRWEARTDLPLERNAPAPANLFCGNAKQPTGYVTASQLPPGIPAEGDARHAALERASASTLAGNDAALRLTCKTGVWATTPGGADLLLQPCVVKDSEWPQVVALTAIGTLLVRGEGLPSALPALEQAMGRMGGLDDAKVVAFFGDANAARDRLVALGGDRWIKPTARDFDDYGQQTETARVEASRKNFGSAEEHYRRALAVATDAFGDQSPGAGLLLMELALQVSNQERFDEAAALFRRADPIIQASGSPADRARLQLYLAFDAANRGRFDDALAFANNASALWRGIIDASGVDSGQVNADANQGAENGELAFTLDLAAAMALRTGNIAAADAAASESSHIIGTMPTLPPWWKAEILTTMGEIRAAQGRMDDADANFRGALILQQRLFGNTAPTAITYLVLGRVYAAEKLYPEAVRAFRLALDILRKDEVARSEVVVDQIAPFITAANALAEANPSDRPQLEGEMFEAAQLIGKSLVDDTINRVAARLAQAAPAIAGLVNDLEQTRRQRDAARLALAQAVTLPADQRGSDRENALLAQINAANVKADGLQQQIDSQFPDYASFAHPGPVTLAEAQKRLRPDEALVLIEGGRERSFIVLVRSDRVVARPIARNAGAIGADVADLRKAFLVRAGGVDVFDIAKSYGLYRALLGPVEAGLDGVKHLIAVPTGALSSLPLALLVTKPGAQRDYAAAQWLVRRTAISEVPSARAFIAQREQPAAAATARPFLGIGNPTYTGAAAQAGAKGGPRSSLEALENECRSEGPVPPELVRALAPLPETAEEVRRIGSILHADNASLLLGADASEPRFRAMPLDQYRVLYFATHGLLPTASRCQSEPALVLSPPRTAAATRDADGVLDASEVAQLHLTADLVVLSACNTATAGGQFGGESLSGLAKAFFHAGARTVVASNWEVPSAQTVQLMTGMFQRLGPTLSSGVAEALRQSQLALIARPETAHPFFWAAFTVIGDGGATNPGRGAERTNGRPVAEAAGGPSEPSTSERRQ